MSNKSSVVFYSNGKKIDIGLSFEPSLFMHDSCEYNPRLAEFSSLLTMTGYNLYDSNMSTENCGIRQSLISMGMTDIDIIVKTGEKEVETIIASGNTVIGNENNRIVIVCLVGSRRKQWYDNFDCGPGKIHRGFSVCEKFVYEILEKHLGKYCSSSEKIKFLVTGHSRGGAVASLVAKHLIDEEKYTAAENVYSYCFASPAYCRSGDRNDPKYSRIFSLLNEEDFVVKCMPEKWNYGRYGTTYFLPNSSNCHNYRYLLQVVNSFYSYLNNGKKYSPYKKGPETVNSLIRTLLKSVGSVDDYYNKKFRCLGDSISLKEFFTRTLCVITAEPAGSKEANTASVMLVKAALDRFGFSELFRSVASFFVFYEGLAGIFGDKIFKKYFSSTHEMETYCAYTLAAADKLSKGE